MKAGNWAVGTVAQTVDKLGRSRAEPMVGGMVGSRVDKTVA